MRDDDFQFKIFMVGTVVGGVIGMLIGAILCESGKPDWRKAAVEHNAARWITASDGSTKFEWIERSEK